MPGKLTEYKLQKAWDIFVARAGIARRLTIFGFRHALIVLGARATSIETQQERVGHANLNMTLRYFKKVEAVEVFEYEQALLRRSKEGLSFLMSYI